jgi:hypothetical protein
MKYYYFIGAITGNGYILTLNEKLEYTIVWATDLNSIGGSFGPYLTCTEIGNNKLLRKLYDL